MNPTLKNTNDILSVQLAWAKSTSNTNNLCNLGDSLSPIIICSLMNLPVEHINFTQKSSSAIVSVGSIGHQISLDYAIYWGPGIEEKKLRSNNQKINFNPHSAYYRVLALRGPISAINFFGHIKSDIVYFDPAMELPRIFPKKSFNLDKKKSITIIPHLSEIDNLTQCHPNKKFYNSLIKLNHTNLVSTWCLPTAHNILEKLREIISSEIVLSKSFHGLLIGICYGVPSALIHHDSSIENPELRFPDLRISEEIDWRVRDFFIGQKIFRIPTLYVNLDKAIFDCEYFIKIIKAIPKVDIKFSDDAINKLYSFYAFEKPNIYKASKYLETLNL